MKIYYVYHSCFIIETDSSFLIFDYFKKKQDKNQDFVFNDFLKNIFKSSKNLYVFSSHSHQDHFNREVLSWVNEKPNTYYILSSDIKLYSATSNAYMANQNEEFTINDLIISTFGSTDQGISFLVNTDNLNIFHAGDLNWWKWMDDTPEEEKEMETAFKNVIKDIIIKNVSIDIAFFPVDGRLEQNYSCGGQYFIEQLSPKVFVPMHFWEDFSIPTKFKNSLDASTKIIEIQHNNEIVM